MGMSRQFSPSLARSCNAWGTLAPTQSSADTPYCASSLASKARARQRSASTDAGVSPRLPHHVDLSASD